MIKTELSILNSYKSLKITIKIELGKTGAGTGGIVGGNAQNTQSHLTLSILDCENCGIVSGYQYVGDIAGLIRNTLTTNTSIIDNCYNYRRVNASGGNSACGIIGEARINVTNCGCYSEAILSPKSGSTQAARTRSEIGACGYITYTYTSSSVTHTGNRLIYEDGSDYVKP